MQVESRGGAQHLLTVASSVHGERQGTRIVSDLKVPFPESPVSTSTGDQLVVIALKPRFSPAESMFQSCQLKVRMGAVEEGPWNVISLVDE